MHKQFQKFGLFVSKNFSEEPNSKNNKIVKYLYKNDDESPDKSQRRKIKSVKDSDIPSTKHTRKYTTEDKHRSHGKKISDSTDKKHRKKELSTSETEIYFISPEEIKRHRKKLQGSREKSPQRISENRRKHSDHKSLSCDNDTEKLKSLKREDDIAKFIKKKHKESEKDDYEWLTKKEIVKLISNVSDASKNPTVNSNFFKKFFLFDKHDSLQDKHNLLEKHLRKINRYSEENTNNKLPFNHSLDSTDRKLEKICKGHEKKTREYSREHETKKHHDKIKLEETSSPQKHHGDKNKITDQQSIKSEKKRKSRPVEEETKFIFEDVKVITAKSPDKATSSLISDILCLPIKEKEQSAKTSKLTVQNKEPTETSDITKEESDRRLKNKSRTNPKRHRDCLVKNTFSLIEIKPSNTIPDGFLEKKKRLKAFKKYYKYNRNLDKDSEVTTSTTFHTFSDSHKLYQDNTESVEDTSKKKRRRSPFRERRDFKLETHISSVIIPPEPQLIFKKTSSQHSRDSEKKNGKVKTTSRRSRIPVRHYSPRIIQLAKDSLKTPKSRQKSADLFVPKIPKQNEESESGQSCKTRETIKLGRNEKNEEKLRESVPKEKSATLPKSATMPKKTSNSKSRPTSADVKPKEKVFIKPKTKKPPPPNEPTVIDNKDSKMSRASTMRKQNKMGKNSSERNDRPRFDNSGTCKSRNPSLSPQSSNLRRQSLSSAQKGIKSPSKLSNDGTSSVWSKNSRKTNQTSITSKSDTKLRKASTQKKLKSIDKSSAKISLSNSTMNSSRNGTSFFLTKSYRDDDKLNRWQKRKIYADSVRQSVINKNQKSSPIPPQVLEVRYLTVSTDNPGIIGASEQMLNKDQKETASPFISTPEIYSKETQEMKAKEELKKTKEFYDDDLPQPSLELVENDKFKELFALPIDKALNEILSENYNFLKKDFSFTAEDLKSYSSSTDISSEDLIFNDKKEHDWYNFQMQDIRSLSEISCCQNSSDSNNRNLHLDSQDYIIDSLSAPGSEESGYDTIKSRPISRSFFERPDIKSLFHPPVETSLSSYCVEVQIATQSSSHCGLEIRSIESKSLQTTAIEYSQKSVQIKLSEEERGKMRVANCNEEITGNDKDAVKENKDGLRCGKSGSKNETEVKEKKVEKIESNLLKKENLSEQQVEATVCVVDYDSENTKCAEVAATKSNDGRPTETPRQCENNESTSGSKPKTKKTRHKFRKEFKKKMSFLFCCISVPSSE